jgi:hypothetical protein
MKKYLVILSIIILISFALMLSISITYQRPVGDDIWFHLRISRLYAEGKNAMFESVGTNSFPYPPLFHLIFVPFILIGLEIPFATLLQVIFYPLAMITVAWLMWKKVGRISAIFTILLLLSSFSFFDRTAQVTPQAFDMIFMPLAVYFFFNKRTLPFLASFGVMVYSHAPISFLLFAPFLLYSLMYKENRRMVYISLALMIPLILISIAFIPTTLTSSQQGIWSIQNPQEAMILENPLQFLLYMGILPSIFIPLAYYYVSDKRKKTGFDKFVILWLLFLLPMGIFWIDRLASYIIVPLSILIGSYFQLKLENKPQSVVFMMILVIFMISIASHISLWIALINNMFYVH